MKRRAKERNGAEYRLTIYIAGDTPKSQAVVRNTRKLCKEQLTGKFSINVIDIAKHPELARENNLLALPMVVRTLPPPIRKMIGDLQDELGATIQIDIADSATKPGGTW
jgi:circadian clock protein KaiB